MAGGADKQHGSRSGRQAYFNFRTGTGPCGHIITGHRSLLGLLSRRAQLSLMWLQGAPTSCVPQHPEAHGSFLPLELAAVSQAPLFSPSCFPEDPMMRRVQMIQDDAQFRILNLIPSAEFLLSLEGMCSQVSHGHLWWKKSHLRAPKSPKVGARLSQELWLPWLQRRNQEIENWPHLQHRKGMWMCREPGK